MKRYISKKVAAFLTKKEEGASMVEYGLLLALIAVVCIAAIRVIGVNLDAMFDAIGVEISGATPASGS